jgi:hypothetical protein
MVSVTISMHCTKWYGLFFSQICKRATYLYIKREKKWSNYDEQHLTLDESESFRHLIMPWINGHTFSGISPLHHYQRIAHQCRSQGALVPVPVTGTKWPALT